MRLEQSAESAPRSRAIATLPMKVLAIAGGEGIARITNLLLAVFLARKFGVRAAGAWALAQALALYLMQGTDFGLRHAGARMVTQQPDRIPGIVRFIQRRRIWLAAIMCAAGFAYGSFGPVPADTRALVSMFALATFGYGLSLDWLAWGMEQFALMSAWRAFVALAGAGLTVAGVQWLHWGLLALPAAFAAAYLAADLWLWLAWARGLSKPAKTACASARVAGPDWRSAALLGIAMLVNQAFSSIDTMMLGGLTDSTQTGLYSAAYKLLLLALALYYLIMQALYPQLAAIPAAERGILRLRGTIMQSAAAGVVAAAALLLLKGRLIELLFGPAFAASSRIAGPLLIAVPLDFVASVFLTVLVAWDHPRRVLRATVTAVVSNVTLNCFLIPRFGATGAAWATPLSYLPFLAVLYFETRSIEPRRQSPQADQHSTRASEPTAHATRFSLVLATLGRVDTLEAAFQSFADQRFRDFEVIIVDQNPEGTLEPLLARWRHRFRCLHLRAAPGVSRARNMGIAASSGEIVAFPDDDCWYPEELLENIDRWFHENSSHSLLSACARDENGCEASSRWPRHSCPLDRLSALRTCSAICLFIRRNAVISVGGFDTTMGPGGGTPIVAAEDLDLAIRVLAQNPRGWFEKEIWVGHPARDAFNTPASRAFGYGRGFGYLLRKHGYSPALWFFHLFRAFGGMSRAVCAMRPREARFYWNSMKGRIHGYLAFSVPAANREQPAVSREPVAGPE